MEAVSAIVKRCIKDQAACTFVPNCTGSARCHNKAIIKPSANAGASPVSAEREQLWHLRTPSVATRPWVQGCSPGVASYSFSQVADLKRVRATMGAGTLGNMTLQLLAMWRVGHCMSTWRGMDADTISAIMWATWLGMFALRLPFPASQLPTRRKARTDSK